ncbi:cortex morphogenetic protein CmpA [Caldalkalibacillus salinus]|nr:cortex morphogenetic protein CmpA [Caldalkalibacillus salinus]
MPFWLQRQLRRAFYRRDVRQIQILNDCWYTYHQTHIQSKQDETLQHP